MLRVLSKLLEEPSLPTTLKDVYFIYISLPLYVRPLLAIIMWNTHLFQETNLPTTDPLLCVMGPILMCLANSAVVCCQFAKFAKHIKIGSNNTKQRIRCR
jgi:hypothetical protein